MRLFTLIDKKEVHTQGAKIIPAQEYAEVVCAVEIVEEAKRQHAALIEQAHVEREAIFEQARQEGFNAGQDKWSEQLNLFSAHLLKLRHEMQTSILPIALKATRQIVADQLKLHPETIVDIVRKLITSVSQCKLVKIHLCKSDAQLIEKEKADLKLRLEHADAVLIEINNDLEPGDCILETEKGIINAKIETLFTSLETAFAKSLSH